MNSAGDELVAHPDVIRERHGHLRCWARLIVDPVSLVDVVMTRRVLHGLRERAERT